MIIKINRTHAFILLAIALALPLAFNNCAPTGLDDATTTAYNNTPTPIAPLTPDQPVGPQSSGDPGPGSGLWIPPGTSNRIVADPSGPAGPRIVSYIPGCLNGGVANNSATGCAANSNYTGTLAGTNTLKMFSFGSGKILILRYRFKENIGVSTPTLLLTNATGGAVGRSVRIWLSPDPTATYDIVPGDCKNTSSTMPILATGPGHCPTPDNQALYYFGIQYDDPTPLRFQVVEGQSDFY